MLCHVAHDLLPHFLHGSTYLVAGWGLWTLPFSRSAVGLSAFLLNQSRNMCSRSVQKDYPQWLPVHCRIISVNVTEVFIEP